jgi:hypothetical protein
MKPRMIFTTFYLLHFSGLAASLCILWTHTFAVSVCVCVCVVKIFEVGTSLWSTREIQLQVIKTDKKRRNNNNNNKAAVLWRHNASCRQMFSLCLWWLLEIRWGTRGDVVLNSCVSAHNWVFNKLLYTHCHGKWICLSPHGPRPS